MCCHIHLILFAFISAIIRLGCVSCKNHLKLKMSVTIHALILFYILCWCVWIWMFVCVLFVASSTDFYSFAQFICLHSCYVTGVLLHRGCPFCVFFCDFTGITQNTTRASSVHLMRVFMLAPSDIHSIRVLFTFLPLSSCISSSFFFLCVTNKRTNIISK